MSLNHLFTAARVLRSSQQIVMTVVFFYYLASRIKDGRKIPRSRRRLDAYDD